MMLFSTVFVSLCAFGTSTLTKTALPSSDLLRCQDGSLPYYYFKRHGNDAAASSKWLIYLQGGGQCWDKDTCDRRPQDVRSSDSWPEDMPLQGIFTDKRMFNYNKVFVRYCSSDAHMGNTTITYNDGTVYHFRGAEIVSAVLRHLVTAKGLAKDHSVIFGGGSAGGRGAMVHLDSVQHVLDSVGASGVRVRGFLDSPAYVDLGKQRDIQHNFVAQTMAMHEYLQVPKYLLGTKCQEEYPRNHWKCMFGEYRLPLLYTPYFLVASRHDAYQIQPTDGDDIIKTFENKTFSLLQTIVAGGPVQRPQRTVWSYRCFTHYTVLQDEAWNTWTTGWNATTGTTLEKAFKEFDEDQRYVGIYGPGWAPTHTCPPPPQS